MAIKDKMKNNNQPLSSLATSSAWFWGIPAFTLSAMILIGLSGSNRPLFLYLNELFYFQPEYIWINITLFGDAAMVMILLLPLVAKHPELVVRTFIAAIITTLFLHGFKENLIVLRPPSVYSAEMIHQLGNQFWQGSFPSGHSAAPFTLASMVIFLVNNTKIRSFIVIYASIIALSRIATGVHWPIDILGGAFFGWLAAYITLHYIPVSGKNLIAQRLVTLLLLYAAVHLAFIHDAGDVEAHFLEVTTPIICFILSLKGLKSLFLDPLLLRAQRTKK